MPAASIDLSANGRRGSRRIPELQDFSHATDIDAPRGMPRNFSCRIVGTLPVAFVGLRIERSAQRHQPAECARIPTKRLLPAPCGAARAGYPAGKRAARYRLFGLLQRSGFAQSRVQTQAPAIAHLPRRAWHRLSSGSSDAAPATPSRRLMISSSSIPPWGFLAMVATIKRSTGNCRGDRRKFP